MKTKNKTKVSAVECPYCFCVIYSRAHHDFHYCTCGKTAVDGGFEYQRILWTKKQPKFVELEVRASKQQLYDDWNTGKNKFGLIPPV
jgi:hypothetical protein